MTGKVRRVVADITVLGFVVVVNKLGIVVVVLCDSVLTHFLYLDTLDVLNGR